METRTTLTASDIKAVQAVAEQRTVRTSTIDPHIHGTATWRTTTLAGDVYETHCDTEASPTWSCSCVHGRYALESGRAASCWHRTAAKLELVAEGSE